MSQNSDTHSTCNERLAREGEKATCCTCNPHEGCTLGMKPTKTPTQKPIHKYKDRVPNFGKILKSEYPSVESSTTQNEVSSDPYDEFIHSLGLDFRNGLGAIIGFHKLGKILRVFNKEVVADARKEVITDRIDRSKLYEVIESIYLSGMYKHDKGVLRQYMSDIINVLATLREE